MLVISELLALLKGIEVEILGGKRQRYRNREQIKGGHMAAMGRYNNTWFLKGGGITPAHW